MSKELVRYPISKLISHEKKQLVEIYRNQYWIVDKEENVLFARGRHPQCNSDERISKMVRDKLYPEYEIRLIEVAYVEIRIPSSDWEPVPY